MGTAEMAALQDFFAMGGYAAYIWPAYGLAALVMLGLLIGSLRRLRVVQRQLRALEGGSGMGRRRARVEQDTEDKTAI
mgnify:CR=1 FL=1